MEREGYQKRIDDLLNAVSSLLDANNAMGEKLENAQLLGERPAARGRKGPDERNMDKDMILRHEAVNDGRSVYLHYDEESGCYKAFGLSAYYADMAASPVLSFSEDLQMPVARLSRGDVMVLRNCMVMKEHIVNSYYWFWMNEVVGDKGYERWKERYIKVLQG